MKIFGITLLFLLFSHFAYAEGVCSAKQRGQEAFCEAQSTETSCNVNEHCLWANAGYGACSTSQKGYEAFCGSLNLKDSCQFHSQCFWLDPK